MKEILGILENSSMFFQDKLVPESEILIWFISKENLIEFEE